MHLYSTSLAVWILATAVPIYASPLSVGHRNCRIKWTPCKLGNTRIPMECGNLVVPLDYTDDKNNQTLRLQLQRAPSRKATKDSKSILLNFGGPGADGIGDFVYFAERMQAATGGGHHLINLVPRGTNETLPFSCFSNDVLRTAFQSQPLAGNASSVALSYVWEKASLFDAGCQAISNKTGVFIGTAFVARDLMQIVDALGEDGMLRFWGVSYGTILGATTVAMFPDKVDKAILDGVVNPFQYYNNEETELFTDTDATFKGFIKGCVANPKFCPLAKNQTAQELEESLYRLFQRLKFQPIAIPEPGIPGGGLIIDYSLVSGLIFRQLYFPTTWPSMAKCLATLMSGNKTDPALLNCLPGGGTGFAGSATTIKRSDASVRSDQEALSGIKCSDVRVHTNNLADMLPVFKGRHRKSRFFGDSADSLVAQCAQWNMSAKERYMGDFNVKSRKPLLVIGNTCDPVTPLISAQNVSASFKGSVLLQHDAYGHDSLMQASFCTAKAIRAYFVNGTLPERGTTCDVKVPLFSGEDGWKEVIEQLETS